MPLVSGGGGGGGGSSTVLTATKTLSSADLLALNSTPVQVIAAPGANKIILPVTVAGLYVAGATPYTGSVASIMRFGPAAAHVNYPMLENTEIQDIFTQATSQVFFGGNAPATVASSTAYMVSSGAWDITSKFENLALVVDLSAGIGPSGDGTCRLWIAYVVADLS